MDGFRVYQGPDGELPYTAWEKRGSMRAKRPKVKPIVYENAPEHPYKKYESHPYWKRIDKGISDLVENQDLVEREARPYIVGYLCKMLLRREKSHK